MTGAEEKLQSIVYDNPILHRILTKWDSVALPDCWISGSAIAQTAWNAAFGMEPTYGLADIDIVYFDAAHLAEEEEARQSIRIRTAFPELKIWIDAKNEARVHLWYASKFGYSIEPYRSSRHAISTFPTTSGSIGIRPGEKGLEIFAPFGLDDLLTCTVRPNKVQITKAIYENKVGRWKSCWPQLKIVEWDDTATRE